MLKLFLAYLSLGMATGFSSCLLVAQDDDLFRPTNTPISREQSLGNQVDSNDGIWGDYDGDGDLDLYITNIDNAPLSLGAPNFFYENQGNGRFRNETRLAFILDRKYSVYGEWVDYDLDQDLDLYIANGGGKNINYLYQNTFDQSSRDFIQLKGTPVTDLELHSPDGTWADFDNDGDMDLFLALWEEQNRLYRNDGDNVFTDVTNDAGASSDPNTDGKNSWKGAWGDFNNDGFIDIFISQYDGVNNSLFQNLGNGKYKKITEGPIVNDGGFSAKAVWGDYNNDGFLDLFVSNFDGPNFLYRNVNGQGFVRETDNEIAEDDFPSYGCAWGDFNNDGWLDLFVAHLDADEADRLYINDGAGDFDIEKLFDDKELSSKNGTWADYDRDGDLDLLVLRARNQNELYENRINRSNTPPAAPGSLKAEPEGDNVTFSWGAATDPEQNSRSLSYEIWVWPEDTPEKPIVFPYAVKDGQRMVSRRGMIQGTTWKLQGLAEGNYCWRVQAVDHGLAGSPFSEENCFTIGCSLVAEIATEDEQEVCAATLELEATPPVAGAVGTWSASDPQVTFSPNANQAEATAEKLPEGKVLIFWTVSQEGCPSAADTLQVSVAEAATLPRIEGPAEISVCEADGLTLRANPPQAEETGRWTASSPQVRFFPDEASPEVRVDNLPEGMTQLKWTLSKKFCTAVDTAEVAVKFTGRPAAEAAAIRPDTCLLGKGRVQLALSGGTAPYEVLWDNTPQSEALISEVNAGTHEALIKDLNGCADTLQVEVPNVDLAAGLDLGSDTTLCAGDTLILDAGIAGAQYRWTPGGATTRTLRVTTAGTYRVEVQAGNNCQGNDEISVAFRPAPQVDLGPDTSLCGADEIILTPEVSPDNATFQWSDGSTDPFLIIQAAGLYGVRVTDPVSRCTDQDTIAVGAAQLPALNIEASSPTLCNGQSVTLRVDPVPGATLAWSTGETGTSIQVSAAGTYLLTATTGAGCSRTDSLVLEENTLPIFLQPAEATIRPGDSVRLNISGGTTYRWTPAAGLSCSDCPDPWASPDNTTRYAVTIEGENCSVDTTIEVKVLIPGQEAACNLLRFPNVITPNGDSKNERWIIDGLEQFPENSLQIFDRWGGEAYGTQGYANDWQGNNQKGQPLMSGTYYYLLKITGTQGGQSSTCFGEITLIR